MKKYLVSLFAALAIISSPSISSAGTATADMLVILTSADRETQAMAMILSNQSPILCALALKKMPLGLSACNSASGARVRVS